jgi:hypothetical protein
MITSNGAFVVLVELALDESQDEIGFAHASLAEQHQLELENLVVHPL